MSVEARYGEARSGQLGCGQSRQVGQGKVWFDGVRSVGLRRVGQGKVRSVRAGYDQLGYGMSVMAGGAGLNGVRRGPV